MGLKDTFSRLKDAIVGTQTAKIDDHLDQAVKDIASFKTQSGRLGYIELVKSLIAKQGTSMDLKNTGFMGSTSGMPSPAMYGQANRINRYKTYESIVSNITYCYRAMNVIVDNILSPDDITKKSLDIKPQSYLEDETDTESRTKLIKEIVNKVKLEQNLDMIIYNTLVFGDFFVEIGTSKSALTSKSYLVESENFSDLELRKNIDILEADINDKEQVKIVMDFSLFNENEDDSEDKSDKKNEDRMDINEIKLSFHDPKNIVKLQSELFPICFGYLVFPRYSLNQQLQISDQAINNVCLSILRSLETRIPDMKEFSDNKELKDIISTIIKGSDYSYGKALNIRFVPPDKMEHFRRPSMRYYPYGESILDSVVFLGKVLISLETALTIQRLSRSTEKRQIAVEIGLPRDAKKMIMALKEQFRKRKISLDSFGTVDTIPSMITTFEDIYVPQKDGKRFVEISPLQEATIDVRNKVEELKFMRDSLVASLGVPPAFLALEENVSVKSTLSDENVLFARTVIRHQQYLTNQIIELIQKIIQMINPEKAFTLLENVLVALPAPKSLQFELMSRRINDTVGLIENLERIGVPKELTKKKYLQDIDWTEVDNYQIDADIEKKLGVIKKEYGEGGFGMGGMGEIGGGMGGFGGGTPPGI